MENSEIKKAFLREGFAQLHGVFSEKEIEQVREAIFLEEASAEKEGSLLSEPDLPQARTFLGDLLSRKRLKPFHALLFHPVIQKHLKVILGPMVYFGESTIQIGIGSRGFHKDNVPSQPNAPEWRQEYQVVKVLLYLQDHFRHSGGLKIRERSHQIPNLNQGRARNLDLKVGDVLLMNQRLTHSGNAVRPRFFRSLCLAPKLERRLPSLFAAPEQRKRILVVGTFAAQGEAAERYEKTLLSRADMALHWKWSSPVDSPYEEIEFRKPIPEYGCYFKKPKHSTSVHPHQELR